MNLLMYADTESNAVYERVEEDFRTPVKRLNKHMLTPSGVKANPVLLDSTNSLLVIITSRPYSAILDWVLLLRSVSDIPIILAADNICSADEYILRNAGIDDFHSKAEYDGMLCLKIRSAQRWIGRIHTEKSRTEGSFQLHKEVIKIISPENQSRRISPNECKLLDLLLRKQGEVISRSEISRHVFRREWDPTDKSIDMLVCKVRGRFKGQSESWVPAIETVRGVGYMLRAG